MATSSIRVSKALWVMARATLEDTVIQFTDGSRVLLVKAPAVKCNVGWAELEVTYSGPNTLKEAKHPRYILQLQSGKRTRAQLIREDYLHRIRTNQESIMLIGDVRHTINVLRFTYREKIVGRNNYFRSSAGFSPLWG